MSNTGQAVGTPISNADAVSDSLCRVSGYLKDVTGAALRGYALTVRHVYSPIGVVPDAVVLRERRTFRSDSKGYIQFDLLRGAHVDVEIPNRLLDHVLHCVVPDRAAADLVDVLFPYVVVLEFVTASPAALEVGDVLAVQISAVLSNGETVALTAASTLLESSDDSLLVRSDGLSFTAVAAGTVTLSVSTFNPDPLLLLLEPDLLTPVVLFSVPDPAFPDPVTVVIT